MIGLDSFGRQGGMNYPRRQQYRRLFRAGRLALVGLAAALLALFLLAVGAAVAGALFLGLAVMLGLRARHWLSLAARSGVGARSEDEVHRALGRLRREGWRVRHSVSWPGGGDIDSLVVAPSGVSFAVETKTRVYDERHLRRVREQLFGLAVAGARPGRCRFCASSGRPGWSAVRAGCWSSRSTASLRCCSRSRTPRAVRRIDAVSGFVLHRPRRRWSRALDAAD